MDISRIIILLTVSVLAFSACSSDRGSLNDMLAEAENAVERGNFKTGQELCSQLVADTPVLSVDQLCRMGVIYATLADNDVDRESNMASAAHMLEIASDRNPDSVTMFIAKIPYELQAPVRTALRISQMPTDSVFNIPAHDEPDSVYVDEAGSEEDVAAPDGNNAPHDENLPI